MTPELFERITRGHRLFVASLPDTKGGGFIKQGMVRSADEAELFVKAYGKPTQSVYFCVGHLRDGATERRKENVASVSCVWADIDFKHHPDLTPAEIERRLGHCRMLPTRIVHSGGGLQVFWDLLEPIDVTGPAAAKEVEEALRLAAGFVGGDPAVCEIARLMRLPGSYNTKYGKPREVRLVVDRASGYELSDLIDHWLEDAPVIAAPALAPKANGHDHQSDPYTMFAQANDTGERLDVDNALDAMEYPKNVHTTQLRIALSLVQAGMPIDEITARLMAATRRAAGAEGAKWDWEKEERDAILRGAIGSAITKLCKEYDAATGEVPPWVPPEMQERWAAIVAEGGIPRIQWGGHFGGGKFILRDVAGVAEARQRERDAKAAYPSPQAGKSAPGEAEEPLDIGAPKGGSGGGMFDDWSPYVAPNEATIPRRQWLYGKHYLRGTVSASVGAPGRLKSTTTQTEALAMVIDRDLMHGNGDDEHGELRVAYLNGEEGQDELDRRHVAMCKHYNIPESAYAGRLWIKSTRDKSIRLAETDPKGRPKINGKVVTALKAWCDANHIDVLIVDPLISFHSVRENANEDMDLLCKQGFGTIAGDTRAVELVHHPRKPAPGEVNTTVDDMRGASSVLAAVRTARTFNFMTSTEASQLRVNEDERRSYVRIENGKGGPGPVGKARWARIKTEALLNGDTVAVAALWKPPDNFTTVDPAHTQAVIVYARQGSWRTDPQSPDWLGWKVIEILGLKARPGKRGKVSAAEKADKDQAAAALAIWEETGVIARTEGLDEARRARSFYTAGPAADAAGPLDITGED